MTYTVSSGTLNLTQLSTTGPESGGEFCGIFKFWSFLWPKSVNNVCKFSPGPHWGFPSPRTLGCSPPNENSYCRHGLAVLTWALWFCDVVQSLFSLTVLSCLVPTFHQYLDLCTPWRFQSSVCSPEVVKGVPNHRLVCFASYDTYFCLSFGFWIFANDILVHSSLKIWLLVAKILTISMTANSWKCTVYKVFL